jgi:predicted nucleic acid-binding Zn ribbon protein
MMRSAERIAAILPKVLEQIGQKKKEDFYSQLWQEAAGSQAAQHSRVVGLSKERLIVIIDSSAWLYQLNLLKKDLLKKIRRKAKDKKIAELYLRLGEVK